jgi:hypothetical protein
MALAILIAAVPMPEPPAWTRIDLARLQPGVVEQHVLHGAEADRRAGRCSKDTPLGTGHHERSGG